MIRSRTVLLALLLLCGTALASPYFYGWQIDLTQGGLPEGFQSPDYVPAGEDPEPDTDAVRLLTSPGPAGLAFFDDDADPGLPHASFALACCTDPTSLDLVIRTAALPDRAFGSLTVNIFSLVHPLQTFTIDAPGTFTYRIPSGDWSFGVFDGDDVLLEELVVTGLCGETVGHEASPWSRVKRDYR